MAFKKIASWKPPSKLPVLTRTTGAGITVGIVDKCNIDLFYVTFVGSS